jgi:hypothetical protein
VKTQYEYARHNADNLEEGWDAVSTYADDAILATWDGCHKIYLAMDEQEAQWFRDREDYAMNLVEHSDGIVEAVKRWWDESCGLRFVNAVWRNQSDPNAGYVSLISQWAGEEDDEEEEEEDE